jgi:hypothetical protein
VQWCRVRGAVSSVPWPTSWLAATPAGHRSRNGASRGSARPVGQPSSPRGRRSGGAGGRTARVAASPARGQHAWRGSAWAVARPSTCLPGWSARARASIVRGRVRGTIGGARPSSAGVRAGRRGCASSAGRPSRPGTRMSAAAGGSIARGPATVGPWRLTATATWPGAPTTGVTWPATAPCWTRAEGGAGLCSQPSLEQWPCCCRPTSLRKASSNSSRSSATFCFRRSEPRCWPTIPWVRRGATPSAMARHVTTRVYRSKPFCVTAAIAQAIFSASRSLPEYTFTAESFPCSKPFVWLHERLPLRQGELVFPGPRRADWHR